MNKDRRSRISKLLAILEEIHNSLQTILDEEQDYFDNMPENLQGSVRGMDSEEAINILEETVGLLEETVESLRQIN